jgi:sugar phosphate permease
MSIISGYLAQSLGWRGMFIVEGLPAIIWAFLWLQLVDDEPAHARWLSPSELQKLNLKLHEEQHLLKPMAHYREAFKSSIVIALSVQYFCWSIGVYGFVIWLPSILRSASRLGIVELGWLSAAPYFVATVCMIVVSHFSDRSARRKPFVWPFLIIGGVAFAGSYVLGEANFWLSFVLLVIAGGAMYAPYGPFFAWFPETLPRNVAGGAIALINSCGALGGFVGSYLVGWLNAVTGEPALSYLVMAASLLLSGLITLAVGAPAREPLNAQSAFAQRSSAD